LISIFSVPSLLLVIFGNADVMGVGGDVMNSAPKPVKGACTFRTHSTMGYKKPISMCVLSGWNLSWISR
jgi:hypothetical protein